MDAVPNYTHTLQSLRDWVILPGMPCSEDLGDSAVLFPGGQADDDGLSMSMYRHVRVPTLSQRGCLVPEGHTIYIPRIENHILFVTTLGLEKRSFSITDTIF